MELLNPAFVFLVVKIAICVLPGVVGIFFLSISEDKKRELRNTLCNRIFGVSNVIPYPKFDRSLTVIGILGILVSAALTWFVLLSKLL